MWASKGFCTSPHPLTLRSVTHKCRLSCFKARPPPPSSPLPTPDVPSPASPPPARRINPVGIGMMLGAALLGVTAWGFRRRRILSEGGGGAGSSRTASAALPRGKARRNPKMRLPVNDPDYLEEGECHDGEPGEIELEDSTSPNGNISSLTPEGVKGESMD